MAQEYAGLQYKGIYFIFSTNREINERFEVLKKSAHAFQLFTFLTRVSKILFVSEEKDTFDKYWAKINTPKPPKKTIKKS